MLTVFIHYAAWLCMNNLKCKQ